MRHIKSRHTIRRENLIMDLFLSYVDKYSLEQKDVWPNMDFYSTVGSDIINNINSKAYATRKIRNIFEIYTLSNNKSKNHYSFEHDMMKKFPTRLEQSNFKVSSIGRSVYIDGWVKITLRIYDSSKKIQ